MTHHAPSLTIFHDVRFWLRRWFAWFRRFGLHGDENRLQSANRPWGFILEFQSLIKLRMLFPDCWRKPMGNMQASHEAPFTWQRFQEKMQTSFLYLSTWRCSELLEVQLFENGFLDGIFQKRLHRCLKTQLFWNAATAFVHCTDS